MTEFTDAELIAFLEEALSDQRSTELEAQLRQDAALRERLITVRGRETAGLHTLGAIWRRSRLSCPTREQLGQYVLETLPDEEADYIRFHLDTVECRYCAANLADLQSASQPTDSTARRRKYFQTSAGYLRRDNS
ncbi:hypothetical protein NHH03_18395 [Stieleria sp. TO1_6]|uniref:hypothetical protein n=1 Tax=Stieleria tagensis TaxID=2956795 RepID=UPI00209B0C2D|nr:hypothetical protein [Stieleria tagensis]MCO8123722.1 hypothetical protein [Stieleria tagensis]